MYQQIEEDLGGPFSTYVSELLYIFHIDYYYYYYYKRLKPPPPDPDGSSVNFIPSHGKFGCGEVHTELDHHEGCIVPTCTSISPGTNYTILLRCTCLERCWKLV